MTPQDLIQFRNEQNQSETELEFLAFLLNGLRKGQKEANELSAQIVATEAKEGEKRAQESLKSQEIGEVQSSLLSYILDEIRKKDIDLSAVIAGLESVRSEIEASRKEDKEEALEEVPDEILMVVLADCMEPVVALVLAVVVVLVRTDKSYSPTLHRSESFSKCSNNMSCKKKGGKKK